MEKLKKYKKQIFTFVTIFLLLEFGIYPCLTMANTFANIIGALGLLSLVGWFGLELYSIATNQSEEEKLTEKQWQEHLNKIQSQIKEVKPKRKYTKKTK
jgi:hypothetical protein